MKTAAWQTALINAITDPRELWALLDLDPALLDAAVEATTRFPLKVPREFVARMEKGNCQDPLLRQIVPLDAELSATAGYSTDPLQEEKANPIPGLLHKYHGRVLLTFVGTCAVNCRYCFRRHFPYADNNVGKAGWEKAMEYIAKDPSIQEVILSGGDPLIANDKTLHAFSEQLNTIPHVKRLRIHSRLPIVLPERITAEFIHWLKSLRQKPVIVVHCNHAHEINQGVEETMQRLKAANVLLLNQSVLLKGINDDIDTLINLSEKLFSISVQPYYLHVLDKVQNTAHFDLDRERAKALHHGIMQQLPGYLVPKLVVEVAGAPAKLLVVD